MKLRELSYASPTDPLLKRWFIQCVEQLSGRDRFLDIYRAWQSYVGNSPDDRMSELLRMLDVNLQCDGDITGAFANDPLVIVANHPFGLGDGIAIMSIAESLGRPFKVLMHRELLKVPELDDLALPIDFSETRDSIRFNIEVKRQAMDLIKQGTVIVIFPAGGVATAANPFGEASELPWKTFTAKLVSDSRASILPVFFEGQNSFLFHLASRFSQTVRLSLLVSEFRRFAGSTVYARVGDLVPYTEIINKDNRVALMNELYLMVHSLKSGFTGSPAHQCSFN